MSTEMVIINGLIITFAAGTLVLAFGMASDTSGFVIATIIAGVIFMAGTFILSAYGNVIEASKREIITEARVVSCGDCKGRSNFELETTDGDIYKAAYKEICGNFVCLDGYHTFKLTVDKNKYIHSISLYVDTNEIDNCPSRKAKTSEKAGIGRKNSSNAKAYSECDSVLNRLDDISNRLDDINNRVDALEPEEKRETSKESGSNVVTSEENTQSPVSDSVLEKLDEITNQLHDVDRRIATLETNQ